MTDKQPDALFYADKLEKVFGLDDYAIEMRRLCEENKQWGEKCNLYIQMHDAVVRDNEELYAENVRLKNAVAAEREACAQVCESLENDMVSGKRTKDGDQAALTAAILSERIRARGYK